LSNALKYSSPLRTAKIHFQSHINDEIALIVSDNGLELTKRNMERKSLGLTKSSINTLMQKELTFLTKAQVEGMWRDDNRSEAAHEKRTKTPTTFFATG
jgi:two-component sensor histidine kinase